MLIVSDEALQAHVERWRQRPWLALDTEFVREDTYFPKLALIQVGDGESSMCIDAVAVKNLEPLRAIIASPDIVKVLHSPDQDLEIFVNRWGIGAMPLFDSQLAATFLGIAEQPSYAALVASQLGVTLDKSLTRTPWLRRPLRPAEIAYAAADVEHLATLYPRLEARLREVGRLAWLQEDCARMAQPEPYLPQPEKAWARLKSLPRMPVTAQHVAASLAAWREATAAKRDRPRRWVLSDEAIYALANARPETRARLEELAVLSAEQLQRDAAALLDSVQRGLAVEAPALATDLRDSPASMTRFTRLQQVLRDRAAAVALPASLIAPRADLEAIANLGDKADVPALCGWRREVAGEALLAVVQV
jgi:ribonuclease D